MQIVGIIPARYASTRFPGKPLIDIGGKTMIQRVYEQTSKAKQLTDVIVATDDERIYHEVTRFGGKVVMTSAEHTNGTERCAEVAQYLDAEVVINIQGDEPFIQPEQIDLLASAFLDKDTAIATLIRPFTDSDEIENPNRVKAFVDEKNKAVRFSRHSDHKQSKELSIQLYKHIGLYAFRKDVLLNIVQLSPSPLEIEERLEQLRWLENGYNIHCMFTEQESLSIDTPEDLHAIIRSSKKLI